ncbi:signal recognition particle-docking protein FtsY [Pirellulaceae bacterium SH449]
MVFWKRKQTTTEKQTTAEPITPPPDQLQTGEATTKLGNSVELDTQVPLAAQSDSPAKKESSWWSRVLSKTNELLRTDIRDLWKSEGELVDDDFLKNLYAILIRTDMGNSMATKIRESIHGEFRGRRIKLEECLTIIRDNIAKSLSNASGQLQFASSGPTIILVVGVNGSGKTTSIAKLAHRLVQNNKRVLLGAGDTFRAAAVEQLRIWSERIGCDIVLGEQGSDPGTVVFRATKKAVEESYDVCILDTAGRLQTQSNLMQELEKIKRVVAKQVADGPHEVLLVLDATAGQNAISQAKGFSQAAGCTGIVLAKLDGSAKGGVVVPISEQFALPVKFVGLGEKLEDLSEFNPESFARALFD